MSFAPVNVLGLPTDRGLTNDELDKLSHEAPLTLDLRFPIINRRVTAKVWDARESDYVYLYWGNGQFGPLNVRKMYIVHASD